MKFRIVALGGLLGLSTLALSATNIKLVDWGNAPADGTANIVVVPQVVDLTHSLANVTFDGLVWGTRPGIFQFDVQHDYDAGYHRAYLLCVELEAGVDNGLYGYKGLAGYAGFLASKIGDIVHGSDPSHIKAAALALTMWELDYDAYDPILDTVHPLNLSLLNGRLTYVQTGESLADYNAIMAQANVYIAELQGLDARTVDQFRYRYYTNPLAGQDENRGAQDFVGGDVPGPLAAIPFAMGIVIGLRRRKK